MIISNVPFNHTPTTKHIAGFKEMSADFLVDMSLKSDYEEIVGHDMYVEYDTNAEIIGYESVMVMELLWLFDDSLRKTDYSRVDVPLDVNKRKEYGIFMILEDYLPPSRKEKMWGYYYRKSLERDINNKLSIL